MLQEHLACLHTLLSLLQLSQKPQLCIKQSPYNMEPASRQNYLGAEVRRPMPKLTSSNVRNSCCEGDMAALCLALPLWHGNLYTASSRSWGSSMRPHTLGAQP